MHTVRRRIAHLVLIQLAANYRYMPLILGRRALYKEVVPIAGMIAEVAGPAVEAVDVGGRRSVEHGVQAILAAGANVDPRHPAIAGETSHRLTERRTAAAAGANLLRIESIVARIIAGGQNDFGLYISGACHPIAAIVGVEVHAVKSILIARGAVKNIAACNQVPAVTLVCVALGHAGNMAIVA